MTESALTIPSGDLVLEGILYTPDGPETGSVVVICHPHPQRGGDMYNAVVTAVAYGLLAAGIGALTFNFRGVHKSSGSFDGGAGEQDDVRAALTAARALPAVKNVGLAGYSFGAGMAAAVADDSVPALALVSIPATMASGLNSYAGPVLLVSGDSDPYSGIDDLRLVASELATAEVKAVPGADHFWMGYQRPLANTVRDFFAARL